MATIYEFGPVPPRRGTPKCCFAVLYRRPLGQRGRGAASAASGAGRVHQFPKDALIEGPAWPRLAVEDSNLTVQIAALRRVFEGKMLEVTDWIETLPRRGYRYVGAGGHDG